MTSHFSKILIPKAYSKMLLICALQFLPHLYHCSCVGPYQFCLYQLFALPKDCSIAIPNDKAQPDQQAKCYGTCHPFHPRRGSIRSIRESSKSDIIHCFEPFCSSHSRMAYVKLSMQFWLPDSPRWLMLSGRGKGAAQSAVERLRGRFADAAIVQNEVDEMAITSQPGRPKTSEHYISILPS